MEKGRCGPGRGRQRSRRQPPGKGVPGRRWGGSPGFAKSLRGGGAPLVDTAIIPRWDQPEGRFRRRRPEKGASKKEVRCGRKRRRPPARPVPPLAGLRI